MFCLLKQFQLSYVYPHPAEELAEEGSKPAEDSVKKNKIQLSLNLNDTIISLLSAEQAPLA